MFDHAIPVLFRNPVECLAVFAAVQPLWRSLGGVHELVQNSCTRLKSGVTQKAVEKHKHQKTINLPKHKHKTKPKQDNPTSNAPQKKTTTPTTRVFLSQAIVKQGETAPSVRLNEMLPETIRCPIAAEETGFQDGKNSRLIC